MYFEDQASPVSDSTTEGEEPGAAPQLKGKGINNLGIVTLHEIDILEHKSFTGHDIACMMDSVFLVNSHHYDLNTDPTSYVPEHRTTAHLDLWLAIKEPYMNCVRAEMAWKGARCRTTGVGCACAQRHMTTWVSKIPILPVTVAREKMEEVSE